MAVKLPSISPLIQKLKSSDVNSYNYLQNLNKRVAQQIDSAVRASLTEPFDLGYYINAGNASCANNIAKFTSPIDSYVYHQSQVSYFWSLFATRTANATNPDGTPFVNGQLNFPGQAAANSGAGQIYHMRFKIDPDTGIILTEVSYFDGTTETITNDGLLHVSALCSRAKS